MGMKGIILAGGLGSRLYPLTQVISKNLLPIGKYPMIYYPIYKLKQAGIKEILIVTAKEHIGAVATLLGGGSSMDVNFTYKIQDQPGGIAQALGLAERFVGRDKCVVILGDNIFADDITPMVQTFKQTDQGAKVLLTKVDHAERYGIAELCGNTIVSIEEKPSQPKSNYCVTGIYMYDAQVFDIIRTLKPSARGELEITDVNNAYIAMGKLTYDMLTGWWVDAGTFETLAQANQLAQNITLDFRGVSSVLF